MERVLKYQVVENYMLQELSGGKYAVGDRFFNETDIARQFKVTVLTARRAFAQLEKKGLIQRQRGRGTFVISLPERPQRVKMFKRCLIGIVLGDNSRDHNRDNSFKLGKVLVELHHAIENAGYLALLVNEDLEALFDAEVSGVVVLDRLRHARTQQLLRSGLPVVRMFSGHWEFPGISYDYAHCAEEIVGFFAERGLRHLALVGDGDDALDVRSLFERPLAVACEKAGCRFSILVPPLATPYRELSNLIASAERPDAIFAANSWSLGTISAVLREHELTPGRDISVVAHGSNVYLIPSAPPFSLIDIDVKAVAEGLLRLLLELIRAPEAEPPTIFCRYGPVVDRGSAVPAPARPPEKTVELISS